MLVRVLPIVFSTRNTYIICINTNLLKIFNEKFELFTYNSNPYGFWVNGLSFLSPT